MNINEKAVSKSQQRFMGMVHAAQQGKLKKPSKAVKKAAKSMSPQSAKDFASTSTKGLPNKVEEGPSYSSVAASVRKDKERYPERYCSNPKCLWRTVNARTGEKTPCPKHRPAAPTHESIIKESLTKKDFVAMAKYIKQQPHSDQQKLIDFAVMLSKQDNPRFDEVRFKKAILGENSIMRQSTQQAPQQPQEEVRPQLSAEAKAKFHKLIGKYNEYGHALKRAGSLREMARKLGGLASLAEQAIMSEADDWFDGHTIKRNMKELKSYVNEFQKNAVEADQLMERVTALYDDMGRVLERYFEIYDVNKPSNVNEGEYDRCPGCNDTGWVQGKPCSCEAGKRVSSNSSNMTKKLSESKIDSLTAKVILEVYGKLNDKQKITMESLPSDKLIKFAWKVIR
jgi:hypothetical protein